MNVTAAQVVEDWVKYEAYERTKFGIQGIEDAVIVKRRDYSMDSEELWYCDWKYFDSTLKIYLIGTYVYLGGSWILKSVTTDDSKLLF